jgi:hypothetical protein
MTIDPGLTAAADQAHAEAEHTLNKLINWWGHARTACAFSRADEVAALTHILTVSSTNYAALLATAISRLADSDDFRPYCNRCGIPHAEGKCGR